MVIDGKLIAAEILARTKVRAEQLARRPTVVALVAPESSEMPATQSYLRIKAARAAAAGCDFEVRTYPSGYSDADAVIIQLPLPESVDTKAALDALSIAQDADVLSATAREKFEQGAAKALLPPVVAAVRELFVRHGISAVGKRAVVVGDGWLVGNPCAAWLRQQGALVTVLTKETADLFEELSTADIVISGAGVPHLITPDVLKQGVVLIDAGTSESKGVIAGDADPACAPKCALFTPVPGGVGPIAVACLFENAITLAERQVGR